MQGFFLFFEAFFNSNRNGDRSADHRVVAHTDKSHHLNVSGNRGRTCKLSVAVHSAHCIRHTVAGRTCCHIVGMKCSACTAAGSNGEILLAVFYAPFLVCAGNGMLETSRVCGVTCDGNADILKLHYSNTLGNIVCAIAFYSRAGTLGISCFGNNLYGFRIGVKLGLYISEAVDSRNDESGILAETVEYNAQGLYTNLVCIEGYLDSAFCCGKGFMTCEEAEAFRLLGKKHLAEITVTETDLAVFRNGTGNTESLESDTDSGGSISCLFATCLDSDSGAYSVSPYSVFKTDRLSFSYYFIAIYTCGKCDFLAFLDRFDAVICENAVDFINSSLISFK